MIRYRTAVLSFSGTIIDEDDDDDAAAWHDGRSWHARLPVVTTTQNHGITSLSPACLSFVIDTVRAFERIV